MHRLIKRALSSSTECQIALAKLERNLVAKAASIAPSPDPEAQARYEQARRRLLHQLQASANLVKPE